MCPKQHFSYVFLCKFLISSPKTGTTSAIVHIFKKFKLDDKDIDLL